MEYTVSLVRLLCVRFRGETENQQSALLMILFSIIFMAGERIQDGQYFIYYTQAPL